MKFMVVCAQFLFLLTIGIAQAQTPPGKNARYSCFIFKDMNRNGIFDMGDKPHAGLRLKVTRPDGSTSWVRSNIDGFANLPSSLGNTDVVIFEPGLFKVRAVFPEGWETVSSTDSQEIVLREQPNARSGLIPVNTCRPIGLAPVLEVRGNVTSLGDNSPAGITVVATNKADGKTFELPVNENGAFKGIGWQGDWRLEIRDASQTVVHARDFRIEHGAVQLSNVVMGQTTAPELDATYQELDFDEFLVADTLFEIPAGYGDLYWLNLITVHNRFYRGAGYMNNTVSSEFVAYNSSGVPVPIWADNVFDFKGVYVGVAWPRGEEAEVIFRAWRGEKLAYEDRFFVKDDGPIYFDANYEDITRMEFSHGNYERVVLDNFHHKF